MGRGIRDRDQNIFDLIRKHKSRVIMEIGVWRCENAVKMIEAAAEQWPIEDVTYYGFDVFADISVDGDRSFWKREKSSVPWSLVHASERLRQTGASVILDPGMTKDTLPVFVEIMQEIKEQQTIDFVWLDGGHTYETVANDWRYVQQIMAPDTVVLFDDFAIEWRYGKEKWGVNRVVNAIDRSVYTVEFLDPVDPYDGGRDKGQMCVVKVMLK